MHIGGSLPIFGEGERGLPKIIWALLYQLWPGAQPETHKMGLIFGVETTRCPDNTPGQAEEGHRLALTTFAEAKGMATRSAGEIENLKRAAVSGQQGTM